MTLTNADGAIAKIYIEIVTLICIERVMLGCWSITALRPSILKTGIFLSERAFS